nr:hypothetical protein [Tanacetum cinerariifolium]
MKFEYCHEPYYEGSGSAWMAYMNARIAGLLLLVLLGNPNEDVTWGRNDDPVTSGIRAKSDQGGLKQNRSSCSLEKFLKVLAAQRWCRSFVLITMHEVVHELVVVECHEPNSEGSGFAWTAYMNARIVGLFLLVLLGNPNGKGVLRVTSRGLDMAPH